MSRRAIGRNYVETFGNRASHAAFAELEPSLNYSEPSGNLGGMGHSITINLSDKTWQDLLRAGRDRNQPPETVAEQLLSDLVADPLMRLPGCIESPITDLSERLDEYLGLELLATHDE